MKEVNQKKLLHTISYEINQLLGGNVDRILVYGSYARGDARPDSDIDILTVLKSDFDYAALIRQTSELIARLSLENDVVISRAFLSKERFERECSPFNLNVRREGITI